VLHYSKICGYGLWFYNFLSWLFSKTFEHVERQDWYNVVHGLCSRGETVHHVICSPWSKMPSSVAVQNAWFSVLYSLFLVVNRGRNFSIWDWDLKGSKMVDAKDECDKDLNRNNNLTCLIWSEFEKLILCSLLALVSY
jgi:hypothetical protein